MPSTMRSHFSVEKFPDNIYQQSIDKMFKMCYYMFSMIRNREHIETAPFQPWQKEWCKRGHLGKTRGTEVAHIDVGAFWEVSKRLQNKVITYSGSPRSVMTSIATQGNLPMVG